MKKFAAVIAVMALCSAPVMDTWLTLRGNIVERISDDLYVFKDASGTINVDIDHKRWNGVTVTPKDTVEIQGEVDKDWNSVEIDVKQIRKVNP